MDSHRKTAYRLKSTSNGFVEIRTDTEDCLSYLAGDSLYVYRIVERELLP